ncbi:MAG: MFS transporter [Bacteriovoracaceae bacterium]|nr:MFS transporter [Bacteriovoracaceae bacterium]
MNTISETGHTVKQEKLAILMLLLAQVVHVVDFVIMMPLGPKLMRLLTISPAQFGVLVSAYTFSAGIFSFLGSAFMDRFERKYILLVLYTGFVVGTFFCGFATSYETLLFARIVAGGFGGIMGATVLAMVGDYVPAYRRGTAMGIILSAFPIASVLGVPVGLHLANQYNWQTPFLFLGALSTLFLIICGFVLPKVNNQVEAGNGGFGIYKKILLNSYYLNAMLFIQLLMFSIFFVIPFISPYTVKNLGVTENQLPIIYLFSGSLTFFTSRWLGKMADKYTPIRVFKRVLLLSLIPIILITHLTNLPFWVVVLVTCCFMSIVSGRNVPGITLVLSMIPNNIRGSFMTISSSFQQFSVGLATFLAGTILSENADGKLLNYRYCGYISVFISLLAFVMALKLIKKKL